VGADHRPEGEGEQMVRDLQASKEEVDVKLRSSKIQLFAGSAPITGEHGFGGGGAEGESGSEGSGSDDSGSDWSDDEGDAGGAAPREDGRSRRAAVFEDGGAPGGGSGSEDDSDDGGSSGGEESSSDDGWGSDGEPTTAARGGGSAGGEGPGSDADEGSDEDSDEGSDEDGDLHASMRWKEQMLERGRLAFAARGADLESLVYGGGADEDGGSDGEGSDDDGDALFRARDRQKGADENEDDLSRMVVASSWLEGLGSDGLKSELKERRFVTGDWQAGRERAEARPDEEGGGGDGSGAESDEVYGDFEDVETGEKFSGAGGDAVADAAREAIEAAEEEERRERKAAQKAQFDAEYEKAGGKGKKLAEGESGPAAPDGKKGARPGDADEETYYDAVKKEMQERADRTKAAMDALHERERVEVEGHRPGAYVRLRFRGIPAEMVDNFDPRQPLVVGGVPGDEAGMGFLQLRVKRHRWHRGLLKNQDPLILSVGWRRFQTLPTFAVRDDNGRYRMLKYTPEHMHCLAVVWAPLAPPNTGVVCVKSLSDSQASWRVSATGVVLEQDASVRVAKKLKLVGYPLKVHKHTAFVKGMFNSMVEASKFEGASIRTVSGIRGTIKKASREGTKGAPAGSFRAVFEDKPLMSDIVFLRAWVQVDLPRFHNPVTNLLHKARDVSRLAKAPKAIDKVFSANAMASNVLRSAQAAAGDGGGAGDGGDGGDGGGGAAGPVSGDVAFQPSDRFRGSVEGFVFQAGPLGLGYYEDFGPGAEGQLRRRELAERGAGDGGGWRAMRTTGQLRRDAGVGAPVEADSLYRDVERAPKRFNPLRVPRALQKELPFKSKPKLEKSRAGKRKTLEQKRAVVLEKGERKMYTLVQQLNAIRNQKAEARREQAAKSKAAMLKRHGALDEWRAGMEKEKRKRRYQMAQAKENREAKKGRRG